MMFVMFDERTLRAIMFAMFDERAKRTTSIFFVYRKLEYDSLINRVQLILSFDLLLRLLSYKLLLLSDCLHCLKTSTNLFNSITLSNIFVESTSVTIIKKKINAIKVIKFSRNLKDFKISLRFFDYYC